MPITSRAISNKKLHKIVLIFFLCLFYLLPSVSILSFEKAPSDPQEADIINVINDVSQHFGWDKNFTWTHYYEDYPPKNYTPTIWGPRAMNSYVNGEFVITSNMVGYGIDIVPPTGNDVLPCEYLPIRILAYRSEEAAKKNFNADISLLKSIYQDKKSPIIKFHGITAVHSKELEFSWRMGRFIFNTSDYYVNTKRVSEDTVAEALYQSIVKVGLGVAVDEKDTKEDTKKEDTKKEEPPKDMKETTFEIRWDTNPATSKPYQGLVLDGQSTVQLHMVVQNFASGDTLRLTTQPKYGTLTGDSLSSTGTITVTQSTLTFTYTPKEFLPTPAFKSMHDGINAIRAEDVFTFTHIPVEANSEPAEEDKPVRKEKTMDFSIFLLRPPVMLVHGFTGDQTTWAQLADSLHALQYDTHIGSYYALDHSIQAQARLLKGNIQSKKEQYAQQHILLSRVDIIAHSMGGLLSRYYINNASYYQNDVRKLLMVGTPNHGCSWTDLQIGRVQSYLGDKHKTAAEQLYSEGSFMQTLNQGESMGSHLVPGVEYGNIYSYSALPGFFSGDVVVSAASAYLNGVATYRLTDHTHSTVFSSLGPAITTSPQVFTKLQYWLTHPIRRIPLRTMHINISRAEGEVYVKRLDAITQAGIPETPINTTQQPIQAVPVESLDYIGTHQGKAMISLYLNDIPWGYIHLDADTELRLGYVSPRSIEVKLLKGKARFTTFALNGKGHFSVEIMQNDGYWQNIIGLNTDYLVERYKENVSVYSIEGDIMLNIDRKREDLPSGQRLHSSEGVEINRSGDKVSYLPQENPWWKDNFYEVNTDGWVKIYFSDLWKDIQYQVPFIWTYISTGRWIDIPIEDIMDQKVGIIIFGLAVLAFLFLFIAIVSHRGSVLMWIPVSIIIVFVWYTLSQYGILPFI